LFKIAPPLLLAATLPVNETPAMLTWPPSSVIAPPPPVLPSLRIRLAMLKVPLVTWKIVVALFPLRIAGPTSATSMELLILSELLSLIGLAAIVGSNLISTGLVPALHSL